MSQLANVPRPRLGTQPGAGAFAEALRRQAVGLGESAEEVLRETGDVLASLAQRRDLDDQNREPVVEVQAEGALLHQAPEIRLCRRDQLHVDVAGLHRAESPHLLLLDRLEHLALHRPGQRIDFVEEEGPSGSGLEQPRLHPLGVGEGAGLEAEEFGLEHGLGDRGAVDVDERAAGARATVVDHPRHQSLARAGLAEQENRRHVGVSGGVEGAQPANVGAQRDDRVGASQDRVRRMGSHGPALNHIWPKNQQWPWPR